MAGRHEPGSRSSFYLSLATAALRAALVVGALVLGFFVLSRAFPTGGGAAPITPGGEAASPTTAAPPEAASPEATTSPPRQRETHDPSEIQLQVLNGTDVSGLAADTAAVLEAEGYPDVLTGDAPSKPVDRTQIFFKPRNRADAQVLRERFFSRAELAPAEPGAEVAITVVLGVDHAERQTGQ